MRGMGSRNSAGETPQIDDVDSPAANASVTPPTPATWNCEKSSCAPATWLALASATGRRLHDRLHRFRSRRPQADVYNLACAPPERRDDSNSSLLADPSISLRSAATGSGH